MMNVSVARYENFPDLINTQYVQTLKYYPAFDKNTETVNNVFK